MRADLVVERHGAPLVDTEAEGGGDVVALFRIVYPSQTNGAS
jgi:hypothetical protein